MLIPRSLPAIPNPVGNPSSCSSESANASLSCLSPGDLLSTECECLLLSLSVGVYGARFCRSLLRIPNVPSPELVVRTARPVEVDVLGEASAGLETDREGREMDVSSERPERMEKAEER